MIGRGVDKRARVKAQRGTLSNAGPPGDHDKGERRRAETDICENRAGRFEMAISIQKRYCFFSGKSRKISTPGHAPAQKNAAQRARTKVGPGAVARRHVNGRVIINFATKKKCHWRWMICYSKFKSQSYVEQTAKTATKRKMSRANPLFVSPVRAFIEIGSKNARKARRKCPPKK